VAGPAAAGRIFLPRTPGPCIRILHVFFFENWLYTATYMADARAMALPLVTTGDPITSNTTGTRFSQVLEFCPMTRKSPPSSNSWDGAEC